MPSQQFILHRANGLSQTRTEKRFHMLPRLQTGNEVSDRPVKSRTPIGAPSTKLLTFPLTFRFRATTSFVDFSLPRRHGHLTLSSFLTGCELFADWMVIGPRLWLPG